MESSSHQKRKQPIGVNYKWPLNLEISCSYCGKSLFISRVTCDMLSILPNFGKMGMFDLSMLKDLKHPCIELKEELSNLSIL